MRSLVVVVALAGCSDSGDVTGPFSGELRRFVVDAIQVPHDSTEASMFADDLDGDGATDNQLGNVTGVLSGTNDLSLNGADMIAAGALASVVTIQADDLTGDSSAGVTFYGAEGEPATVVGGRFAAGTFTPNLTRETHAPGAARVHLPIYTNADPLVLPVDGLEIELTRDGSDYFGIVRGGIRVEDARAAAYSGLVQMFEDEPERHLVFLRGIDADHDDVVTRAEVDDSVIALLVTGDIALFDGSKFAPHPATTGDSVSVGFGIHLTPCASGTCTANPPMNLCRDRVRDGDETDVDCGGSCQPCWDARHCSVGADCQSGACDAGSCRAATCSDGVKDGFESDIDCGGHCSKCGAGKLCASGWDCASASCSGGVASLGTCVGG